MQQPVDQTSLSTTPAPNKNQFGLIQPPSALSRAEIVIEHGLRRAGLFMLVFYLIKGRTDNLGGNVEGIVFVKVDSLQRRQALKRFRQTCQLITFDVKSLESLQFTK